MKEFFKKLRTAAYVTALLTIALGVVLVAWPMEVTGLICRVLGALLVVMGAVYIFGYFVEGRGILAITGGLLFCCWAYGFLLRLDRLLHWCRL